MHYWAAHILATTDGRDAPLGLAELGRVDIVNQYFVQFEFNAQYSIIPDA